MSEEHAVVNLELGDGWMDFDELRRSRKLVPRLSFAEFEHGRAREMVWPLPKAPVAAKLSEEFPSAVHRTSFRIYNCGSKPSLRLLDIVTLSVDAAFASWASRLPAMDALASSAVRHLAVAWCAGLGDRRETGPWSPPVTRARRAEGRAVEAGDGKLAEARRLAGAVTEDEWTGGALLLWLGDEGRLSPHAVHAEDDESPGRTTTALLRLQKAGLVHLSGDGHLRLTSAGQKMVERLKRLEGEASDAVED